MRLRGFARIPGKIYDCGVEFKKGVVICRTRNGMLRYLEMRRPGRWTFLSESQKLPDSEKVLGPLEDFFLGLSPSYRYRKEVFSDWDELVEYAEEEADADLRNNLSLVDDFHARNKSDSGHNKRICSTLNEIRRSWVRSWRDEQKDVAVPKADDFDGVVLVTCHGAKGLEFDSVYLFDDFSYDVLMKAGEFIASQHLREMLNLIYVAITRSRENVYLSADAQQFLDWAKDKFSPSESGCRSDDKEEYADQQETVVSEITEEDLSRERESLKSKWEYFLSKGEDVVDIDEIPFPGGPPKDPFALSSSMSISDQRSVIRTYMLRYNKFFANYGKRIQLNPTDLAEVTERINEVCRICNGLWRMLREQDAGD